jgi:hypothetical protein
VQSKLNLKKSVTWLCYAFVVPTVILSCKKEFHSENEASKQELSRLEQWYKVNLKISEENPFSKLKPNWGMVYKNDQGNQTIYEVELENPEKLMMVSNLEDKNNWKKEEARHLIKLLIFENKKAGTLLYASYMSIELNLKGNFDNLHYKDMADFTGTIYYHHLTGVMSNGWTYEKGRIKSRLSPISKLQYQAYQKEMAEGKQTDVMVCQSGMAEKYIWGCVGAGNYESCGWQFAGYEYISVCEEQSFQPDDGNGGGGGGYMPPILVDCAGEAGGNATWSFECNTCIGGTTGLTACPREVRDSVQNPCIKAQLNLALTAKTTILNMLNNTFGGTVQFEDLSLTFEDVTNLPDSIDGIERRLSGIEFKIMLNKNKLPDASKEYILVTIYHEILHAFLDSKLTRGPNGQHQNLAQHTQMANEYVLLMTGALQVAFPGLNSQEAWALSWGGLEKTPFYASLTQAQKNTIADINSRHRSNTAPNKLGTRCTP